MNKYIYTKETLEALCIAPPARITRVSMPTKSYFIKCRRGKISPAHKIPFPQR